MEEKPKEVETITAKSAEIKKPEVLGTIDLNPKPKKVEPPKPPVVEEKPVEEKPVEKKAVKKEPETIKASAGKLEKPAVLGKIDLDAKPKKPAVEEKVEKVEEKTKPESKEKEAPVDKETKKPETAEEDKTIVAKAEKLTGTTVLGKIELPVEKEREPKGKRKRIKKVNIEKTIKSGSNDRRGGGRGPKPKKPKLLLRKFKRRLKKHLPDLVEEARKIKERNTEERKGKQLLKKERKIS